jgi:hypothetical protein
LGRDAEEIITQILYNEKTGIVTYSLSTSLTKGLGCIIVGLGNIPRHLKRHHYKNPGHKDSPIDPGQMTDYHH